MKVFDNLYFVGQTEYSAWAVLTSDGVIVLDPLIDYSVADEVVGGLEKLGADPSAIGTVIVSHGHSDHAGGASFLQDRYHARVILAEEDWDLMDRTKASWRKPRRDIVAGDGHKVTLGDATFTLHRRRGTGRHVVNSDPPTRRASRRVPRLLGRATLDWLAIAPLTSLR